MDYQTSILKRYKEAFPKATLKRVSEDTGIQMTRVFRLFNGAEMKLKEYAAFEACLRKSSLNGTKFTLVDKFQKRINSISENVLKLVEIELNHLLKVNQFTNASGAAQGYPKAL